jgi:hypothetical protein
VRDRNPSGWSGGKNSARDRLIDTLKTTVAALGMLGCRWRAPRYIHPEFQHNGDRSESVQMESPAPEGDFF